jgi:hypoxanthine-guanine phosphoribosyltransferase
VRILKDLEINISGRDVLVVEDIIDSGLTLSYLRRTLGARKPASLEICALLTKPERREVEVPVRYVGFEIPNRFVIGYGLDFAERSEPPPSASCTGSAFDRPRGAARRRVAAALNSPGSERSCVYPPNT